jgi:NTP pyrophosphatase (non-canonical NTP hydrolase)
VDLAALQFQISATFGSRDRARGIDGTFRRLVEEVGEVAKALRTGDRTGMALELSDLVAWTASVAALCDVDLDQALRRYAKGCPRCDASPCRCAPDPRTA